MWMVNAIIRESRLSSVKQALLALDVSGMTVAHVLGFGQQRGYVELYRSSRGDAAFLPKVSVTVVVNDDLLEPVVSAIRDAATTGEAGDGKVFVIPVSDALRIRTGERGPAAL